MPTMLLVRHGRTTANASGVLAGWTPGVGLDEHGRAQAGELGRRLAELPVVRVVASPLQRCLETAALVRPDVPAEQDADLGECRYGAWTGRPIAELTKEPLWRVVQDHPSAARFPEGEFAAESIADMQARAVAACRRIDAQVADQHGAHAIWIAVSHGDVVKAVLADALGCHLDSFQRIVAGPASLSVVTYTQRRPFVVRVNDNGASVDDLRPPADPAPADGDAVPGGVTGAPESSA